MSCAIFKKCDAKYLLEYKKIWFCGDSNTRAIYKDLIWLLEKGTLIPEQCLKTKNENSFLGDERLSSFMAHNGCDYQELRTYYGGTIYLKFIFITRINSQPLIDAIKQMNLPDIIIINSCVWDLSRWGPNSLEDFKYNLPNTMKFFKENLPPSTKVIFTTTLPISKYCRGGFITDKMKFERELLPWNVVEANAYIAERAKEYKFDVLDFHYHLRFVIDLLAKDGIHWLPKAVRFMINLILTHISLSYGISLPNGQLLSTQFLQQSHANVE